MADATTPTDGRCGYVALVGAPNAGKSTLMNRLMGTKVSIVTHKVQTTRARIIGVLTHEDSQIVFVDTPGIFAPRRRLERAMVAAAWGGAADADVIVLLVDVSENSLDHALRIIDGLKEAGRKAVLALNKIDLTWVREAEPALRAHFEGEGYTFVAVSAIARLGLKELISAMAQALNAQPDEDW